MRPCGWRRRGHEVHVISRDHGDGARSMREGGVHYHFVAIPPRLDDGLPAAVARGLWYYSRVRAVARRPSPRTSSTITAGPPGCGCAAAAAPSVISLHSMDYGWGFGYRGWDRPLFTRGLQAARARAVRVRSSSAATPSSAIRRSPANATTVYNGVDPETFTPAAGQRDAIRRPCSTSAASKSAKAFTCSSTRSSASSASACRTRDCASSDRHRTGSAATAATTTRCRRDAHANPRIELRGPTYDDQELAAIYRSATVRVVPSTFPEALGLTSLEAQASRRAGRGLRCRRLARNGSAGRSGFVFANGNADQLGELVVDLLANRDRRDEMARGRARVGRDDILVGHDRGAARSRLPAGAARVGARGRAHLRQASAQHEGRACATTTRRSSPIPIGSRPSITTCGIACRSASRSCRTRWDSPTRRFPRSTGSRIARIRSRRTRRSWRGCASWIAAGPRHRSRSTASRTRIFPTATNSRPRPISRCGWRADRRTWSSVLGTRIRVFVPPHNALSKRGLRAVERGRAQPARIVPVVPSVDAAVGAAHARQLVAGPPVSRRHRPRQERSHDLSARAALPPSRRVRLPQPDPRHDARGAGAGLRGGAPRRRATSASRPITGKSTRR